MAGMSITVTYDGLSVHGAISTGWDAELCSALASQCVGALVNAYEVLHLTSARLSSDAGQAE